MIFRSKTKHSDIAAGRWPVPMPGKRAPHLTDADYQRAIAAWERERDNPAANVNRSPESYGVILRVLREAGAERQHQGRQETIAWESTK